MQSPAQKRPQLDTKKKKYSSNFHHFWKKTYYEEFTSQEQRDLTWIYSAEKIISVIYSY